MKILQNQDDFSTREYRELATPLWHALERGHVPKWIRDLRHNDFIAGFLLYLCAGEYDVVVTISHRPALVYGLFNRLFPRKGKKHLAKEFFFEMQEEDGRLKHSLLTPVYRFALKNADAVIVNATSEISTYANLLHIPESRFHFIPWPTNIDEPYMRTETDGSVLAVGRSLRDWETFFRAVNGLDVRCVVIASRGDLAGLRVPENVELHCDISHAQYLQFLKRAKIVVLPLKETCRSTGQASFLEAMAYGIPVIAADVTGVADYIKNRENGLLYTPGNDSELRQTILELCSNASLSSEIARRGYESILSRFNKRSYALALIEIIRGLLPAEIRTGF